MSGEVPGVAVGRDGHRHAIGAQQINRRHARFLQRVISAGQKHGDGPGVRHRRDPFLVDVLEVIGGQRAEAGGEARAATIGELFGVEADPQAVERGGFEQPLGLRQREADPVAKPVDTGGEAKASDGGEEFVNHHVDIILPPVGIVGRQGMQRQEGGDDPHRLFLTQRARGVEQADLAGRIEAVARLDLDRGATARHQRTKAAAGTGEKLARARGAGGGDSRGDPAAGAGNVLITCASAAHGMFAGTSAAKD